MDVLPPHIPAHYFRPRPLEKKTRSAGPVAGTDPPEKIHLHLERENHQLGEAELPVITVADVMERDVIAVPPDLSLEDLGRLFTEKRVSGFPVVDKRGELLGLVSQKDLLGSMVEEQDASPQEFYRVTFFSESDAAPGPPGALVEDIMTPFVYFATPETDIKEVIELMLGKSIHRVVVTQRGLLKGMVTTSRLLRVLHQLL